LAQKLHIDTPRIGVVGFSLGGHTALGLVGVQADHAGYINDCDQHSYMLDCQWYKTAVATDPALAQAYQSRSLSQINTPLQVINLGAPDTAPMGINAASISQKLPNVDDQTVSAPPISTSWGSAPKTVNRSSASKGKTRSARRSAKEAALISTQNCSV